MTIDDDNGDDEDAAQALHQTSGPDEGGVPPGAELIALATLEELEEPGAIEAFCAAVNEQIEEITRRSTQLAQEPEDWRSRCLADGYLPEHLEGLTDGEMDSLLDYVVGSTPEAAAARLKHMTIWRSETPSEEIAAHHDPARPRSPD